MEKSTTSSISIKVAEKPRQEVCNRIQNGVGRSVEIDFQQGQSSKNESLHRDESKMLLE